MSVSGRISLIKYLCGQRNDVINGCSEATSLVRCTDENNANRRWSYPGERESAWFEIKVGKGRCTHFAKINQACSGLHASRDRAIALNDIVPYRIEYKEEQQGQDDQE